MKTKKQINSKRVFSEDFKKSIVKEYETGKFTVNQLAEIYSIQSAVIYRWIYRYSTYQIKNVKIVEMAESSTLKLRDLQKRIAELERIVGQKQLNIDFLEKIIDIAKDDLGIDIKKNFDTLHSNGSTKKDQP